MFPYYVQVIADNYLRNLMEVPESIQVHPQYLHGISQEEFLEGFGELHNLVKKLYMNAIERPGELDLLLKENIVYDAKNSDYTGSNASFIRFMNTLLLLGYKGTLGSDRSLLITGDDLLSGAKSLKITKIQSILTHFSTVGFEFIGMSKTIKAEDSLRIDFPRKPFLIIALKAMAEAMGILLKDDLRKSKELFYMMNYHLLENEVPKEPKLTVDYIYHTLSDEQGVAARELNDYIAEYAKPKVRMGGFMRNDWSCVYNLTSTKKVIMTINVVQKDLSVKLNLANIGRYIDVLNHYSDELKEAIKLSGWECSNCHSGCAGGFAFELDGKAYNKCRCGSFVFDRMDGDKPNVYKVLLEKEISVL